MFKRVFKKAVYINQTNEWSMGSLLGKLIFKKKFILRMGYDWHNTSKIHKQVFFKQYFKYTFIKIYYHLSDLIIVSNTLDSNNLNRFSIKKKIIVNKNWIDIQLFKSFNAERRKFFVCGRLAKDKGAFI